MKILIPNATGPSNIGDQAILQGLLIPIHEKLKNDKIIVHTSDKNLYKKTTFNKIDHHLYFWSIFSNKNPFVRVFRLLQLSINYFLIKFKINTFIGEKKIIELLNDYRNADLIVFVGGGYFRSQKGFTQSLNLLMMIIVFQFSKLFKARKIIMPMSFGPFAHGWQESLSAKILRDFDIVSVREQYSYDILKKYNLKNLILSSDTALFLRGNIYDKRRDKIVIGFTIRNWLNKEQQLFFENSFLQSIFKFLEDKKERVIIKPITQSNSLNYGDTDVHITENLVQELKNKGFEVLPLSKSLDLNEMIDIYSDLDLLIGMRMHSNILAALSGVPFVAISYEHKTEGIAKQLNMEEYCIKCEDVNERNLLELLNKLYQNRAILQSSIIKNLETLRTTEIARWENIFQNYAHN